MKVVYKSIILTMLMLVFVAGLASALDFDNVKSYTPDNKVATIKNAFGFGDTIAQVEIKTIGNNTNPFYSIVEAGSDVKVLQFQANSADVYANALGNIEAYDVTKGNKTISKTFTYKVLSYVNATRDTYGFVCSGKNVTCTIQKTGTESYNKEVWTALGTADLPKGNVTIGIFTEVKGGEVVDIIPTIYGVRMEKWAVYTAPFITLGTSTTDSNQNHLGAAGIYQTIQFTANETFNLTTIQNYFSEDAGSTRNISASIFTRSGDTIGTIVNGNSTPVTSWNTGLLNFTWTGTGTSTYPQIQNGQTYYIIFTNQGTGANYVRWGETTAGSGSHLWGSTDSLGMTPSFPIGSVDTLNIRLWGTRGAPDSNITFATIISPANNSIIYSLNASKAQVNITLNTDGSPTNCYYNSTWNTSLTEISCSSPNIINFTNKFGLTDIWIKANSSLGNTIFNHTQVKINRVSWNNNTFETKNNTYSLHLYNETDTPIDAVFNYNGINYSSSVSSLGNSLYELNYTIDTPVDTTLVPFGWYYTDSAFRATPTYQQTASQISFGLCNATLTIPYLNVSFKNETTSEQQVTAAASFSLKYFLGSGIVNKSYSLTNATENIKYTFCASPASQTFRINGEITYENSISIARTTAMDFSLTNTTTNQTYYLLPSSLGIYSRYQVITITGGAIDAAYARVSRIISGVSHLIGEAYSDSSGLVVFFLDPTASYDYYFNKDGVGSATFSLVPNSLDTYIVTLGSSGGQIVNGSQLPNNLTYQILPSNSSLLNSTAYTFSFNVSSPIASFISMNITNSTGSQLGYASNAGAGIISANINTGTNTLLRGYFIIQTSDGETLAFQRNWRVDSSFVGDYSLFRQLTLFNSYGFSDFMRMLLVLAIIIIFSAYFSINEVIDTSESKILVALMLIWIFSVVGWMDTGFAVGTLNPVSIYANKYGVAILSSIVAAWLVGSKIAR